MDKPKKPGTKWDPRRVPLHRRIRNRREELGLTAKQLADAVEVSASYISLIENGEKVPGEEVAARIALVLRDDPGLYVAWTHSTRHEDPERQLRDLTRLHTLSSDPALLERLASGEDLDEDEPLDDAWAFRERPLRAIERNHLVSMRRPDASKREPDDRIQEEEASLSWDALAADSVAMQKAEPPSGPGAEPSDQPEDEDADEERIAAAPEGDDRFDMMTLGSPKLRSVLGEIDDAMVHQKQLVGDVAEQTYPGIIRIPVLEDGADPGEDPMTSDRLVDFVLFDARALPLETTGRLFAYRPARAFLRRVGNLIKPDDLVILTSRVGRLAPDRIHAVRREGEILLSRVLYKRNALLLLPAEDSARIEVIDVPRREALSAIIAGSVVTTLRHWGGRGSAGDTRAVSTWKMPGRGPTMSGYGWLRRFGAHRTATTVRPAVERPRWRVAALRGRRLVRDCEWKPRYGWRPVQRAADLDFLEEHPEIKVRFRLLRDGKVRYHLEMDADEWREALGDYADGPTWRRNGYIVPVTKMRDGEYTEEFKERWAPHVRPAE